MKMKLIRLAILLSLGMGITWAAAWVTKPNVDSGTVWWVGFLWAMTDIVLINIADMIQPLYVWHKENEQSKTTAAEMLRQVINKNSQETFGQQRRT